MTERFDTPPVVYLNACLTGDDGLLGGGRTFNAISPYVLVNPARVDAAYARGMGKAVLGALANGDTPQSALQAAILGAHAVDRVNPIVWSRSRGLQLIPS